MSVKIQRHYHQLILQIGCSTITHVIGRMRREQICQDDQSRKRLDSQAQHQIDPLICFQLQNHIEVVQASPSNICYKEKRGKQRVKIKVGSSHFMPEKTTKDVKNYDDQDLLELDKRLEPEKGPLKNEQIHHALKRLLKMKPKEKIVDELIWKYKKKIQGSMKQFLQGAAQTDLYRAQRYYTPIGVSKPQYENSTNLSQFKKDLSGFQVNDYSYLYKIQFKLQQQVGKILDSILWKQNKPIYEPYFQRFLDLMKIKIEFVSQSRFIYPALYRIQRKMETAIDYKGSRRKINGIDQHLTDLLFQHYMQQLQTKSTRSGVYYVRDPKNDQRVPLSQFIASCQEFFQGISCWRDIFAAIGRHLYVRDSTYDPKRDEAMKLFIENIPNFSLPAYDCLGCSQYFFVNHNIFRPQISRQTVALLSSISQISSNASLIKDEIVALLNAKGGVLLFDCSKTGNCIIPRGTYFIQKEKEEIQQKITDYLDGICPKPQINKNIFISWVPIVQDPIELKQLPKGQNYKLNYIQGLYVCRIVVKATYGHVAYYWTSEQRPIFSVRTGSLFDDGKKQLAGRSIYRFIKSKFNTFVNQIKDYDQFLLILMAEKVSTFEHECRKPEVGIQVYQRKKQINTITQDPQQAYKYASVAVAKKQDTETIKQRLKKYGVECVIKTPFENLRLKGAANSAIIYHNTRFEELLSIVSNNKDFEFGGRYLLVISITDYVKLTQRNQRNIMTEADFNSLQAWLHRQYPNQKLKMLKFITDDNDQEFYIQTGSKESSLYIYIVMTQFLERSSFKNPKGLDRMDEGERDARFKIYYPFKKP